MYRHRFNQILAAKSFTHLRAVFEEYSKVVPLTNNICCSYMCTIIITMYITYIIMYNSTMYVHIHVNFVGN